MKDGPMRKYWLEGLKYGGTRRLRLPDNALRGTSGQRIGKGIGESLEFQDYRDYRPGDDLRRLDWNVLARNGRRVVKQFREEVFPAVDIILDTSRSMSLRHSRKSDAALFSAGVLAASALNAGCRTALWATDGEIRRLSGEGGLSPESWDIPEFSSSFSPHECLAVSQLSFHRNGIRIFLSDLLWQGEPADTTGRLAAGASALFVVQVLAEEDITPSINGNCRLIDSESGQEVETHIDAARLESYRRAFDLHSGLWRDASRAAGAELLTVTDGMIPDLARLISVFERAAILEVI